MELGHLVKGREPEEVEEWAVAAVEAGWVVIDLVQVQAANASAPVAEPRFLTRLAFPVIQ
jgi:hypothetical protein